MRKIYLFLAVLLCTITQGYSQITFSENFDGGIGGWTSTGAGWNQTTNDPCTGAGSVRANLWGSSTATTFRSPLLGTSNGGVITLNFSYKILDYVFPGGGPATPNSPAWGTMLVQYATSTTGPWTTVHTIDASNHIVASTCAAKNISFSPPSGDLYIRFSGTWTAGDYYFHVDEMSITQGAAPACATPTNITSSALTTTGATISWDASSSGTASGYQWEIRTSGAAGSGATGLVANGNTVAATLSASTTALAANTTYSVYVRTDCGGTFSGWAGPHTFITPCSTATLPYIQDFESATTPSLPNCTSIENAGTGNNWYTSNNPGSGFTTKVLRYSYNSTNAANAWFYTQPINLTAGTSYRIRYNYGNNSAATYVEKLKVMYGAAANNTSMTELIADHSNITGATLTSASYDFTPSATGVYYFGFNAYSIADQDQLYVDDIMIMVTPTCDEPTALTLSNIATTTAQLDWTAPSVTSPVSYQIYVSTSNTAPTSGTTPTVTGVSGLTANLTSLTPATRYYVWVRSNCGGSDVSIWSTSATFLTECTPATTLSENFDGVTTPALPVCWSKFLRGVAGIADVTTATGNAHTTANAVYLYNSSSTSTADIMLISPPINNLAAGTHRLRFWAKNGTASEDLEIGTIDNKTATATFTLLQSVDITTTYAEYIVDFTGYSGTDNFIAIRRLSTSTFTSVYVDDIIWEVIPSCDAPTLPVFANITATGAEVSWTAPTIGSPVDYQIYYSTTNTAPTGASTPNVTGASTPATLTGLTANTQYYLWIRTNCGSGSLSNWSAMASFRTACNPVSTLPWTENFDALTSTGTTSFPDCWKKENGDWRTSNAGFATQNDPRSTPNYLTNSWSATNEFMWTPGFQLTAGTSYDFSFWWTGDGFTGWTGDVFYSSDQSSTGATQLGASFVATGTTTPATYAQVKESFTPSATGVYYFAIRINANSNPWYLGFDDFKLELTPSCAEPTALIISNLTTTTAQLDWTAPATGSPVNYQVFVSSTNTAPTSGSTPTMTGQTSPSSLTGLTANTTYYVWVRSNCGGTDVGPWAGPVTFTTLCTAATLPYAQNFESSTVPNMPSCTMRENAGSGNNWVTANAPGSGFTSKTLRYSYNSINAANAWFYTQGLNLTGGVSYRVTYRYGNNSTFYTEKLEVKYGSSPASTSMNDLIADHPSIIGGMPTTAFYDFTPATTGVYFVGFHAYSTADQDALFVDDISVVVTPTCNEPTAVTVSNLATTTAQVDWTAPTVGTPASYQLYYTTTNTAPTGSSTPTVTGITGTTTNLTGLTANTTYYLWVRSFCGGTDYSVWTAVVTFTTPCSSTTVPYSQNFETATVPNMPSCTSRENAGSGNNWITANNPGSGFTSKTLRYSYNSANAANAWFYTQGINLTAGTSYRVTYRYGNNNTGYTEKLEVKYGSSPSSSSMNDLIADHPSINTAMANTAAYDFTPSTTGVYYIGFHAYSIADQDGLFVDDISVIATPTCNEPTGVTVSNVTTTGAQVDWTAPTVGTPASYQLYYTTTNTAPTGSTTPTVTGITGATTNLTGLTAATTYYLWIRSFCGGTDNSVWTLTAVSFTTPCVTTTNFAQNFDGVTAPAMPSCWNKVGTTGLVNTQTTNNNSAPNTMYIYSSSASNIAMVSLPPVSNLATGTNTLRFKGRANFTVGGVIEVGYLTTPGDATSFAMIQPVIMSSLTYQDHVITIPALPSGTQVLALRHTGVPANSVLIDNVEYNAALPVTLVDFRGEKAGSANKLIWTTSTEVNNRGFELQRSADGRNFTALTFVASKAENGNSNSTINYSYNDVRPLLGNNYYRLKQIDRDGKTTYSDIVILKSKATDILISSVYPNPATRELNMIITSPSAEKITIVVTDLTGKVIMQQAAQLIIGDNQSQMNVQQLAAGTYLIKAICANGCETTVQRFVKQ